GVTIGAQQEHTRINETLFAQDLVADAPAYLKKVADTLFGHKAAHVGVILGVLGGRGWGGMIQSNGQSLRVLDPLNPQAVECLGDSGRIIVAEGYIRGY